MRHFGTQLNLGQRVQQRLGNSSSHAPTQKECAAQEERGLHVWRMQSTTDWWEDDALHRVRLPLHLNIHSCHITRCMRGPTYNMRS